MPMGCAAWLVRVAGLGQPVRAAIESINGARFVHDQLELTGAMREGLQPQVGRGAQRA
jgi:hypothetical protein